MGLKVPSVSVISLRDGAGARSSASWCKQATIIDAPPSCFSRCSTAPYAPLLHSRRSIQILVATPPFTAKCRFPIRTLRPETEPPPMIQSNGVLRLLHWLTRDRASAFWTAPSAIGHLNLPTIDAKVRPTVSTTHNDHSPFSYRFTANFCSPEQKFIVKPK